MAQNHGMTFHDYNGDVRYRGDLEDSQETTFPLRGCEIMTVEGQLQADVEDLPRGSRCMRWVKTNLFLLLTLVGIAAGFLIGLTARLGHPSADALIWIGMLGDLYMRILKAMVLPLIVCSIIDGTANTDPRSNGRIGIVTFSYIILTNILGGVVGVALCLIIEPGSVSLVDQSSSSPDTRNLQTVDIFADFIRNIFPDNVIGAALQMSQTKYDHTTVLSQYNISGTLVNKTEVELSKSLGVVPGTNILGIIVFSTALGIAASQLGEAARPFTQFFKAGALVIFKLFQWIKWTTPIGVASLIAGALAGISNIEAAFTSMGLFVLTVGVGNLLYQWVILLLLLLVLTRRNPVKFFVHAFKAWIMGFGATSSTIPMPEMMRVSLETYRVDPRVVGFTIPFCVTLNRDGSCLFIAATCLYVGQYTGTTLDAGTVLTIGVLSILSSLAIPPIPSSSIVSVLIILGSVGFSPGGIGLIMAVEWLNDRLRTTSNILSHMVCVLVTWRLCRASLKKKDMEEAHISSVKEEHVV